MRLVFCLLSLPESGGVHSRSRRVIVVVIGSVFNCVVTRLSSLTLLGKDLVEGAEHLIVDECLVRSTSERRRAA